MTFRLNSEDRCAVDLLLEHSQSGATCFSNEPSADIRERLARVEGLLQKLDYFEAVDPSPDLRDKTMALCEERASVNSPDNPSADSVTAIR